MTAGKHHAIGRATNANANGGRKINMKRKRPTLPRQRAKLSNSTMGELLQIRRGETSTIATLKDISFDDSQHSSTDATTSSDLAQTHHLLARLIYRNRHQHRAQHWWRWLCLLRKGVRLLLVNSDALQVVLSRPGWTAEAVRKKLLKEQELRAERVLLESWVREVLVPRCWVAFSGVVGDGSFCALAIALLGALGGVVAVVGVPREEGEDDGEAEAEADAGVVGLSTRSGFDVGEVVDRAVGGGKRGKVQAAGSVSKGDEDTGIADSATDGEELEGGGERGGERREERSVQNVKWEEPKKMKMKTKSKMEAGLEEDDVDIDISTVSKIQTPSTDLTRLVRNTKSLDKTKPRSKLQKTQELPVMQTSQPKPKPKPKPVEASPQKKAKKRKKGNAIDDLFADLV